MRKEKRTFRKCIELVLLFALVFSVALPMGVKAETADLIGVNFGGRNYQTNRDKIMGYFRTSTNQNVDIIAQYKENWIQTTYGRGGYNYVIAGTGANSCTVESDAGFVSDGRYLKISYKVTAGTEGLTGGKLGIHADVQIGDDDNATIEVIKDQRDRVIGFRMVDHHTGTCASREAQYNLYFRGTGGVVDVDAYWFGIYPSRTGHVFDCIPDTTTSLSGYDSEVAFSWQGINLAPGESKTYSFILGVGEKADPPQWSEGGDVPPVTLSLAADAEHIGSVLEVEARVKDKAGLTDTIYYNVDGGPETALGSVEADGVNEKKIEGTIDLSGFPNGTYTFQFWCVNSSGAASSAVTKTIVIEDGRAVGGDLDTPSKEAQDRMDADAVKKKIKDLKDADFDDPATGDAIEEARQAYEDLNDDAKSLIDEDTRKELEEAEEYYRYMRDTAQYPLWFADIDFSTDCPVLALQVDAAIRDLLTKNDTVYYSVFREGETAPFLGKEDVLLGSVTIANTSGEEYLSKLIDLIEYPNGTYTFVFYGENSDTPSKPLKTEAGATTIEKTITIGDEEEPEGNVLTNPLTQQKIDRAFGDGKAKLKYDPDRNEATVELQEDVELDRPIELMEDLILDLKGHDLRGKNGEPATEGTPATDGADAFCLARDKVKLIVINSEAPENPASVYGGNGGSNIRQRGETKAGQGGVAISVKPGVTDAKVETKDGVTLNGGNGGNAYSDGKAGNGSPGTETGLTVTENSMHDVMAGKPGAVTIVKLDATKARTKVRTDEDELFDQVVGYLETVEPGEYLQIILAVEDKTADEPDKDKAEPVLDQLDATEIGAYYDITLTKYLEKGGNVTVTPIPQTDGELTISIDIPEHMKGGSNYKVIRVHGETGEPLKTMEFGNALRFSTNLFSTYAIAYTPKEEPKEDPEPEEPEEPEKKPEEPEKKPEVKPEPEKKPEITPEPEKKPEVKPEPEKEPEDPLAGLTVEEKKAVADLANRLGIDEKTAMQLYKYAAENGIPLETLMLTEDDIFAQPDDNSVAGSSFSMLQARFVKYKRNSLKLRWTRFKGADGYLIYGNKCGKKNRYKLVQTIEKGTTTSYTCKKLKKGTYHKYLVRAYKNFGGKKITVAVSKTIHGTTEGGKYGVAKAVRVNKTKVTLNKNKTFKIKAKEVKNKKKIKRHRVVCYESTNDAVATVSDKGVIKGVGAGSCYVFAYAQNGVFKKIKVTVK